MVTVQCSGLYKSNLIFNLLIPCVDKPLIDKYFQAEELNNKELPGIKDSHHSVLIKYQMSACCSMLTLETVLSIQRRQ